MVDRISKLFEERPFFYHVIFYDSWSKIDRISELEEQRSSSSRRRWVPFRFRRFFALCSHHVLLIPFSSQCSRKRNLELTLICYSQYLKTTLH